MLNRHLWYVIAHDDATCTPKGLNPPTKINNLRFYVKIMRGLWSVRYRISSHCYSSQNPGSYGSVGYNDKIYLRRWNMVHGHDSISNNHSRLLMLWRLSPLKILQIKMQWRTAALIMKIKHQSSKNHNYSKKPLLRCVELLLFYDLSQFWSNFNKWNRTNRPTTNTCGI